MNGDLSAFLRNGARMSPLLPACHSLETAYTTPLFTAIY